MFTLVFSFEQYRLCPKESLILMTEQSFPKNSSSPTLVKKSQLRFPTISVNVEYVS